MTDEEMADKHAEEYVMREDIITENDRVPFDNGYGFQTVSFEDEVKRGFKDGFLAGLKAGRPQWHKVADGDYPDTDRTVLAYSDDVVSGHYPYFAQYYKGFTNAKKNGVDLNWNCWRNNMQRELVEPTVWCEIPTFDKEIE